jgi:hypothetical protein
MRRRCSTSPSGEVTFLKIRYTDGMRSWLGGEHLSHALVAGYTHGYTEDNNGTST